MALLARLLFLLASLRSVCGASSTLTLTTVTTTLQSYTVPTGVDTMYVDMCGARGGSMNTFSYGGNGARVQATFSVTPGTVYNYFIGGRAADTTTPTGGLNGGGNGGTTYGHGGGGATDIR